MSLFLLAFPADYDDITGICGIERSMAYVAAGIAVS